MKIAYAPQALRDIDKILAYIQKRSPRGAHSVSLAIRVRDPDVRAQSARGSDDRRAERVPPAAGIHSARVRNLRKVPGEKSHE